MWSFLTALLNIVPWNKVYDKIKSFFDIPTFLLYGVIFTIVVGLCYVSIEIYDDFNQDDIKELKCTVDSLNVRVNSQVDNDDYSSDYKDVVDYLIIMSKMQQFQYEEMQIYMDVLYKHIQDENNKDPLLRNIEVAKERNLTEYNLLKERLDDIMGNLKENKLKN